jgi:hypothetical protein
MNAAKLFKSLNRSAADGKRQRERVKICANSSKPSHRSDKRLRRSRRSQRVHKRSPTPLKEERRRLRRRAYRSHRRRGAGGADC